MKRIAIVAACLGLATTAGLLAGPTQKANGNGNAKTTQLNYPAKLILLDRAEDGITSDGKGAYIDGVDGVTAVLQGSSSPGAEFQFLLTFSAVKGKYPRSITYHYTTPTATGCDPVPANDPVGSMSDTGFMAFLNVGTMPVGAVVAKQGSFSTKIGTFRFGDATKADPVEPYYCSDLLVATRTSATTWTVTTDATPGQTYFNSAGTPVYTANPEEVGSASQLAVSGSSFIGNYRMPFFATVSCLSATSCPKGS